MSSTPDTPGTADLNLVLRRLAETVAWCRLHVSESDPSGSLRTPALRPANLALTPDQWGSFNYDWGTSEDVQVPRDAVSALAQARADLLRREDACSEVLPDLPVNLAGGRLLIAVPDDSDGSGLSESETNGFIDVLDVPAWDTWVCYLKEPSKTRPRGIPGLFMASFLLCWIPPQFLSLVEDGAKVNPTECFFWAAEYKKRHRHVKTPLLRQLDAAGLLT